jgi:hypothetical protein
MITVIVSFLIIKKKSRLGMVEMCFREMGEEYPVRLSRTSF